MFLLTNNKGWLGTMVLYFSSWFYILYHSSLTVSVLFPQYSNQAISVTAKAQNTFPHIFIAFLKVYSTHLYTHTHTHTSHDISGFIKSEHFNTWTHTITFPTELLTDNNTALHIRYNSNYCRFSITLCSALLCTCQSSQLHAIMQPVTTPSAGRR